MKAESIKASPTLLTINRHGSLPSSQKDISKSNIRLRPSRPRRRRPHPRLSHPRNSLLQIPMPLPKSQHPLLPPRRGMRRHRNNHRSEPLHSNPLRLTSLGPRLLTLQTPPSNRRSQISECAGGKLSYFERGVEIYGEYHVSSPPGFD